jgi:GTP 3',8-cyclase
MGKVMRVPKLIDKEGRLIHKLRVSLLDACNMRCLYCMPEDMVFTPKTDWPKADEILNICTNLISLGIDEIRLTGGEPLLRPDAMEIIDALSKLPIKKLAMTTNAILLKKYLPRLNKTKCKSLNISLDSLNRANFHKITKTDKLESVLEGMFMAQELGFQVKINMVLLRGYNDHEVEDFIQFSAEHNIEVRFLELIKIGVAVDYFDKYFISADEVISRIKPKWDMSPVEVAFDSTSFIYKLSNGASIGFIASESKPFCSGCSRLRLGPDGHLRPCLMINDGPSLRGLEFKDYPRFLEKVMSLKPTGRIEELNQPMYQIGG